MNRSALLFVPLLLALCWVFTGCDSGPIPFLNKATPTPAPTPAKKTGDWMWDPKRKGPLDDKPKTH